MPLPEDVKALAEHVLAHRIILQPDAELRGTTVQTASSWPSARRGAGAPAGPRSLILMLTHRGVAAACCHGRGLRGRRRPPLPRAGRVGGRRPVGDGSSGRHGSCAVPTSRNRAGPSSRPSDPRSWRSGCSRFSNPGRITVLAHGRRGAVRIGARWRWTSPVPTPGAVTRTTYRLPTGRRAVLDIGPLTVARQDPFGSVADDATARGRPSGCGSIRWCTR